MAVLATTLSLMAVFIPVSFMPGIAGRFLRSFGLTMAFAIAVSLLVSFTLTPTLAARWIRFIVTPWAIEPAVDMLQGATTMASMEEEPLETFAAKSSAGATSSR